MNRVIEIGRLTKDVTVTYGGQNNATAIARYGIAVDRQGTDGTDFFNCVAFSKNAEFAEKYLHKGMKIAVEGRLQSGSYTNKEGVKVNTVDIVVERHEFVEKKQDEQTVEEEPSAGFLNVPNGEDEMLPFAKPSR